MYVTKSVCACVCQSAHTRVCVSVSVCAHVCVYLCVHVCVCTCECLCVCACDRLRSGTVRRRSASGSGAQAQCDLSATSGWRSHTLPLILLRRYPLHLFIPACRTHMTFRIHIYRCAPYHNSLSHTHTLTHTHSHTHTHLPPDF